MSIQFVAAATAQAQSANLVVSKPTGTQQGDIMYALVLPENGADLTVPPSGWTHLSNDAAKTGLYYKIAGGSEPSNYTLATGVGTSIAQGCIVSYRGARNDGIDPIVDMNVNSSGGNVFSFGTWSVGFLAPNWYGTQHRNGMLLAAGVSFYGGGSGAVIDNVSWPPLAMTSRVSFFTSDNKKYMGWADLFNMAPPADSASTVSFRNSGGTYMSYAAFTSFLNREENKAQTV